MLPPISTNEESNEIGAGGRRRRRSKPEEERAPRRLHGAADTQRVRLLHLQFDVDAGGEVEALQGFDGLAGRLDDVDKALVDAHLEVFAGVLVDVR